MAKRQNNDERRQNALAIFARAPVPGRVKTRLAQHLGAERACALYRAMLRDILHFASRVPDCTPIVVYTPDDAFDDAPHSLQPFWDGRRRLQRGDNLGARMLHCLNDLREQRYERVVIIGSDAPDIPPGYLELVFEMLLAAPLVFGPARDGGFYLIGSSAPLPITLFDEISWSVPSVQERCLAAANQHGLPTQLTAPWNDVDTLEDLRELSARLEAGQSRAPATQQWLRSVQLFEGA